MSAKSTPCSDRSPTKRRPSVDASKGINPGLSMKIKESGVELQNFLHEWNNIQSSGGVIVDSIKNLKQDSLRSSDPDQHYPQGLQERCDQLQIVIDKMESCLANLAVLVQQFNALVKLNAFHGAGNKAVYLSWSTEKYSQAFQDIYDAYAKEFSLKTFIKEEIAHCINKERLVYYVTCWISQPFIGYSCHLLCESLFSEIGLR